MATKNVAKPRRYIGEMTATPSPKVKEFELGPEFEEFSEINRIYTIGKTLVLEHYTGEIIQSSYYNDDSMKTAKTLRNTLAANSAIRLDFDIEKFIQVFSKVLVRHIIAEAQHKESQAKEEQQQRSAIEDEIKQLKEQNKDITHEEWVSKLQEKYQGLYSVVHDKMPEIWPGLEFELSTLKLLDIEGCTLPFIGVILGRPSSYKTVIISLLKRWYKAFYTDNFTARSFVSHSTAVNTKEELEQIDMLPKIRNKHFLTPELSPMLTAKEDDLIQLLGIITRIAEGNGYVSDSGAHGHRGYDEDIMFTWTAAAVDIPHKVYKILGNLGAKLYFFRMKFDEESIDQLLEYTTVGGEFNDKAAKIQDTLFDYLKWFEIGPNLRPKMKWDQDRDDKAARRYIAGMADVLSYLRCVAQVWETRDSQGSDYAYTISQREVPRRAATCLTNLTRGNALLNGRNWITLDDIPMIINTALDTAQTERVSMFSLLLANGGSLTTNQILQSLNVARKTALRTMAELKAIGLVEMEEYQESEQNNKSKKIVLNQRFNWFLSDSMITKIFPHTTPKKSTIDCLGHDKQTKSEESSVLVAQVVHDDSFHSKRGTGTIYRYGQSDTHGCNYCKQRGDIHYMRNHECNGKK
jgi:hypothetical protein